MPFFSLTDIGMSLRGSSVIEGRNIRNATISAGKIIAGTITANEIALTTILTGNLADGAVTTPKIAPLAVTAAEIAANAITTVKLDALGITAPKIAANAITTDKINANAITAAKIAAGTITASEIAAGTITASEIAAGTITADKMNITSLDALTATMGTLTVNSTLTMGAGGVLRTAASGNRIELTDEAKDRIRFFTGDAFENSSATLRGVTFGSGATRALQMQLFAPSTTGDNDAMKFILSTESFDDSTTPPRAIFAYGGGSVLTPEFKLQNGMKMMLEGGSAASPGLTWNNSPATGIYLIGADRVGYVTGGNIGLEMTSSLLGSMYIRNSTTGNAPNMTINASGWMQLSTSARKYKSRINYNVGYLADYELKPAKFYRKDDKAWYIGFIADDLADEDKLLGTYDDDGEVEDYDLRAIVAVAVMKINRLEEQVRALIASK